MVPHLLNTKGSMVKALYILDATAMAYRAFHALRRQALETSDGRATGGIYGFIQMLDVIRKRAERDPVIATFDDSAPTFRHKKYEEYKATREKMPDDLRKQLPIMKKILEANGIPVLVYPGYEADDVMATVALWAKERGYSCLLVTSDKDMCQLVDDTISILPPPRGGSVELLGPKEVEKKYGVPPHLITDFLALTGDSSDNIPGIPGVGPKRAAELLERFGDLSGVIQNVEHIPWRSIREAMEEYIDNARLSHELVELKRDVPVTFDESYLRPVERDTEALVKIYTELEFATLASSIAAVTENADERTYSLIKRTDELQELVEEIRVNGEFVFDIESTSLDPLDAEPVGISFAWRERFAYYVPLGEDGIPSESAWDIIRPILEDPTLGKGGQNIKYDVRVLKRVGIEVCGVTFDTMIGSYLVDPNLRQRNIDFLSLRYLGVKKIPTEQLIGKGKHQLTMDLVPVEEVSEYACEDADIAYRLHRYFDSRLRELGLDTLYRDVEVPLIPVLSAMEHRGILVDLPYLRNLAYEFGTTIQKLTHEITDLAGEEFNINSPAQLGHILFEKLEIHKELGIKRLKRTKTGYSTNITVLESMGEHPLVERIMEYRNVSKLKNTYVDSLPQLVHSRTGRIHTSFNQSVAATGRLSSSDPNLQNIPVRGELGKRVRKAFIAASGYVLLVADYSKIELRILAHLADDEDLREAFRNGLDIHTETAAKIFNIQSKDVDSDLRNRAKAINFGVLYGMGPRRLAKETGISTQEADAFISRYFQRFPRIKSFIDETLRTARQEGGVRTILGRWRPLPDLNSSDPGKRQSAERMAVNTPIQGSAADLIKLAMIRIYHRLNDSSVDAHMLLQVHDELVFEVREENVEHIADMVSESMKSAISLTVPLGVDVGTGKNWLDAK